MQVRPDDEQERQRRDEAPPREDPQRQRNHPQREDLRPQAPGRAGQERPGADGRDAEQHRAFGEAEHNPPRERDDGSAEGGEQRQPAERVEAVKQNLAEPLVIRPGLAVDRVRELVMEHHAAGAPHLLAGAQLPPGVALGGNQARRERNAAEEERNPEAFARERGQPLHQDRGV